MVPYTRTDQAERKDDAKGIPRLRHLVVAALCRHRGTRTDAVGEVQLHLSNRQRAVRYRRTFVATRRSDLAHIRHACDKDLAK